MTENATWRYNDVRFATLHVVGANNGRNEVVGDPAEAAAAAADMRDGANLAWLSEVVAEARRENARAFVIAMQADMTGTDENLRGKACAGVKKAKTPHCDGFAALRLAIRDAALVFGGPVLLIHGDTHAFTLDQSFPGAAAANLWRLNAAGDGVRDAALVTIAPKSAAAPFAAQGLVTGAAPDSE